ncbi:hypothetical protein BGZ80_006913, partial [Entomortierella chlamydospora]
MLRNPFSSRTTDLSLEGTLELINEQLSNACKGRNPTKALELASNAESILKDAEHVLASKKVKGPALSEGVANAYHERGQLLDGLGYHDKAEKSHAALSVVPSVTSIMYRDNSKIDVTRSTIKTTLFIRILSRSIMEKIFDQNIIPPITKYDLPEPNGGIISTPQLAYCLNLLHPSMISKEELNQNEYDWLQARIDDTDEQEQLQTMATDVIRAFVQEGLKKPNVIAEVVSLAAVLGQDDFRKLLQIFADGINQSVLLDVHLLNGLVPLIGNAPQGCIDTDDLVKILDSMVDSQVEGLSREQIHEPLSDYLKGLQRIPDPYSIYQVAYAYQALQYIPDDETILQSVMRRTRK